MSADVAEVLRYRLVAVLLSFTTLLVPLGLAAIISISPIDSGEPENIWMSIWEPAALVLAILNAIAGIVQLHTPHRKMLEAMAIAAVIGLFTYPFLWFALGFS